MVFINLKIYFSNTAAVEGAGYSWVNNDITEYNRQTSKATPGCYQYPRIFIFFCFIFIYFYLFIIFDSLEGSATNPHVPVVIF